MQINIKIYTGCVTKIRTNFNLNFQLLYLRQRSLLASEKVWWMLLVNSHYFKMTAMLKRSAAAEYNRRAAIIQDLYAGYSATEIIQFFGYPRSTVYDIVAKYIASEQSNEGSSMPARKSHSKKMHRSRKGSSADFGWPRVIIAKIRIIDSWCKRTNNASNWPSIQILHTKDTTNALWDWQDKARCLLQSAIVVICPCCYMSEKRSVGTYQILFWKNFYCWY